LLEIFKLSLFKVLRSSKVFEIAQGYEFRLIQTSWDQKLTETLS
jgi:hypothetical protein